MTKKQRLWLEFYNGGQSPAQAARSAGYKGGFSSVGKKNLTELCDNNNQALEKKFSDDRTAAKAERIASDVQSLMLLPHSDEQPKPKVANIIEIMQFWSELLRSESVDLKDKLKVSELLAKVQGAFSASPAEEEETPAAGIEDMALSEKLALIARVKEGSFDV